MTMRRQNQFRMGSPLALSPDGIPLLFQFLPDMARIPMPANELNTQVLVRTYENDWKDISQLKI